MFWLEEDHPAALAPGKRPRTTLTPTMALRDGEPYLAWGSPGGDQQDQWITQFFLRHVHAGMNLQEAIDAPAWHTEHFPISFWPRTARPGVLVVENRVPKATVDELKSAATSSRSAPTGRKAASPPPRATAAAAAPPPIRAACRATRPDDKGFSLEDDLVDHRPRRPTGQFGIAVATKFSRSARACRISRPASAAVATQALVNPYYGIDG
jgi:hypothetical protein